MQARRSVLAALLAAASVVATAGAGFAQGAYPDRPVRLLVGYPAAGPVDIIARVVADKLSELWGQPVVIENVPGAGGNIAGDRTAKATPDGYTLLMATNAQLAINPFLYGKMTYDTVKDLGYMYLSTDGWDASTLSKGDILELSTVYAVNSVTKATLPFLRQFVVLEDTVAVARLVHIHLVGESGAAATHDLHAQATLAEPLLGQQVADLPRGLIGHRDHDGSVPGPTLSRPWPPACRCPGASSSPRSPP